MLGPGLQLVKKKPQGRGKDFTAWKSAVLCSSDQCPDGYHDGHLLEIPKLAS